MSNQTLPGYWRYMWLFWMQPLLLHRILVDAGIDPFASVYDLRQRGELKSSVVQEWQKRNGFMVFMTYPLLGALLFFIRTFDYDVDFSEAFLHLTIAVAVGVGVGVAFSVGVGVAVGIGVGVATGVGFGVAYGMGLSPVAGAVAFGVGLCVGVGVTYGVCTGAYGMGVVMPYGMGLIGWFVVAYGVGVGVASGVAFGVAYFRIWALPAVAIRQALTYIKPQWRPPILDYDLLYFPIPLLKSGTLKLAEQDPNRALEVLEACTRSPGCVKTAIQIRELLQVRELNRLAREQQWQQAGALQGLWLAGREQTSPELLAFADVARFVLTAGHTQNPYQKYQKLTKAHERLSNHGKYLAINPNHLNAQLLQASLPVWIRAVQQLLADNRAAYERTLPNPFRANQPLKPGESAQLFRGRNETIRQIEDIVGDASQQASLVLLAPRRAGKTSLLRMLELKLAGTTIAFFDLQDNPVDTPAAFLRSLAQAISEAAQSQQLTLPALAAELETEPFACFSQWLKLVDDQCQQPLLLCIDEFERLAQLFPGNQQQLLQLMGLFRGLIQHRNRLRLLVSGATPLDDLDSLWSDHLINLRELRLGYLSLSDVEQLLTSPIPEFPKDSLGDLAPSIYHLTGGQPYLVQLCGSMLVDHLNQHERRQATAADLDHIAAQMVHQATSYFRDTIPKDLRPGLRQWLTQATGLGADQCSFLRKRGIFNHQNQLVIPLTAQWLETED